MKKLQTIILKWNYLFTFMLFFIVVSGLLVFFVNSFINVLGESRIDLLKQVAERSKVINKAAITLADTIYNDFSYDLSHVETEDEMLTSRINKNVADCNFYFDGMDIDLSALIIMRNGFEYSSRNELTSDIREIRSNYWYLDNFSNHKTEFWIMRFGDTLNKTNCMLSYGKVIRNSNGEYLGLILINAAERTYFKVYSDLIGEESNVYILDEDGYAISHSNKSLIGTQIYYMPAFFKQSGQNTFKQDYDEKVMVTNYYDTATKWTIVQESGFYQVYGRYYPVAIFLISMMVLFLVLGFVISLFISRTISRPLRLFARKLRSVSDANFERIDIQDSYEEVYTISVVYNEMVRRIKDLINQIKAEEKVKRKNELDFLQLQINPHFLHNTLFSIKCLVEMSRNDQAVKMLASFMHMLRQPIAVKNEFISVQEEIENLKHYTELMSYRYDNIRLRVYMDEEAGKCRMPRLLLQPIVENSIFHGFEKESDEYLLEIYAYVNQSQLIIKVTDNGIGMTQEEQDNIWREKRGTGIAFNNIGLTNVRKRIQSIYGDASSLEIISAKGEGTEVEIVIKADM